MAQAAQILRLTRVRAAVSSGEARRLREAARLSIGEVARAVGVDQSTVWRWEQGIRRPRGHPALVYGDLIDDLRRAVHVPLGHDGGAGSSHPAPPVEYVPATTSSHQ